jgi:hypothetical protein
VALNNINPNLLNVKYGKFYNQYQFNSTYLCTGPPPADSKCGIQTIKPQLDSEDCPKLKIVGGCPVLPPHSWPWALQLLIIDQDKKFSHECGAALLSPLFALTAAHCFLLYDIYIYYKIKK